jgi:3-hydroxyisobutyrate dehydrogenase-like beta-hydroxyacid dehydrogenase
MPERFIPHIVPTVAGQDIALIGIGRMGTGMGLSLLRHGAHLYVKGNSNRAGLDRLINHGAKESPSLPELAQKAKSVILSLPSSREVEAVCLGANGLLKHLSPDSLILDCTTSCPPSTLQLAAEAQKHGVHFVDAPVTRSPEQAEQGKLNAIVGADSKTFPRAAGVLASFCEGILHAGAVGEGHKMKLVYNSMTMGLAAVAAETCQLAAGLGVDLDALRCIVSRGSTNSGIFQKFAAFLLEENPEVLGISITNAAKDIFCALGLAGESELSAPVLTAAAQKLRTAIKEGRGELTLPHLTQSARPAPFLQAATGKPCRL